MIALVLGWGLLVGGMTAGAQDRSDDAPGANADAIGKQAAKQDHIREQMQSLTGSFQALVADMHSNEDLSDKKAQEIARLVDGITQTDANHVRKAAELLRQAYAEELARNITARKDSLGGAEDHARNAVNRLNALLRMAKALRAAEMINAELDTVILAQDALMADTTRVGKEILAGQEKLSLDPGKVGQDQESLADRASGLKELLHVALSEETTSAGVGPLKRAMAFLDAEKIDARMHMASRNIEQRDMLPGLAEQKEALLALKELVKILGQDDVAYRKDLLSKARDILAGETKLRAALEGMNDDQFKDQAAQVNTEQKNLDGQLEELIKDLSVQGTELPDGKQADDAMDDVSDDLNERNRKKAAADMKRAEMALGKVIESVTQTIPEDKDQAPGQAEPQDVQTMAQEGNSQGMRSSPGQGEGTKDKPGKGEGQAEQGGKSKPTKPNPNGPPAPGSAQKDSPFSLLGNTDTFKGGPLYGARSGNEALSKSSLARRDQMSLDENFAQELPREYRDMLKEYYDRLSRGR